MELTIQGIKYDLYFKMEVKVSKYRYSGDTHDRRDVWGAGECTVRDKEGTCVAACMLAYPEWAGPNHSHRAVNDEAFMRCIEVPGLLEHQRVAYVDWLAEEWIRRFRDERGVGIPGFQLEAPSTRELIERGFLLDEQGQASLPLATVL